MNLDPAKIGLKVGLEVHQQLATKSKLFCNCPIVEDETPDHRFLRWLRPTASELGKMDPAALFEFKQGNIIMYDASEKNSCLVEADEEPPHDINVEAVNTALIIALALGAGPVDELHVMRKIVIDGSTTTGFQRTMVVALGGQLLVKDRVIPVQTVCLEEDAARIRERVDGTRVFSLGRLGVPLIEVALAPVTGKPEEVEEIALALGRLMRSTGRVARGLGTVRQDVNVSVAGGGGVVEVKGVQKLELVSKVIEYEALRQTGLLRIRDELVSRSLKPSDVVAQPVDVSDTFGATKSNLLQKVLKNEDRVWAMLLRGFRGTLAFEPSPGIRLGRELAEMVRAYGMGGIFHSDELPAYGIGEEEVVKVKQVLKSEEGDAFILLAGHSLSLQHAFTALFERLREAFKGVPAETRAPTEDGKTRFSRPRPGEARMYPETDVPPTPIPKHLIKDLSNRIPSPWEEQIENLMSTYSLNRKLALQIYDSDYLDLFESLVKSTRIQPSFIAATLTETLVSLARQGLNLSRLKENSILDLFGQVDTGVVSKEAVPQILELILKGQANGAQEAVKKLGLSAMSDEEVAEIIRKVIDENKAAVESKGEDAFSLLMGRVMATVRGRADGQRVSDLLRKRLEELSAERKSSPAK